MNLIIIDSDFSEINSINNLPEKSLIFKNLNFKLKMYIFVETGLK